MLTDMMLTTGNGFEGYRVDKYLGVMCKEIFFRLGLGSSISASVSNLMSGLTFKDTEFTGSSEAVRKAREYLLEEFVQEAKRRNANAVIAMDFETTILENLIRVAVNGTAVKIEKIVPTVATEEEDGVIRVPILKTNMEKPFVPATLELTVTEKETLISADVILSDDCDLKDLDFEADVIFRNKFGDEAVVKDGCFIRVSQKKGKRYHSEPFPASIPANVYRCVESCVVIVKKYMKNGSPVVPETMEAKETEADFEHAVNVENLIETFSEMKNATEMLAYMNEREADEDDEQTAAIMKILKERQMLERSYGTNVNSTIYRLRKELLEE